MGQMFYATTITNTKTATTVTANTTTKTLRVTTMATTKTSSWVCCCFWLLLMHQTITIVITCRVSEFPCKGSTTICVPLDKYCDGKADCEDGSDEPRHCTVCNRTYYGDIGRTYSIKVPTPQWNKLPFLCHLTFTASGHDQGDIVQIIFDSFTVGRFDEGMVDTDVDGYETSLSPTGELPGCPEGFMQV
uniref:CUB domain-containing protein n=1 Tax=Glossina austeni TaxID=7395 RepID=A0A1A9VD53_GLOAU